MTDIVHEYCEHGICRKCEPCGKCEGAAAGKRAAEELMKEFEAGAGDATKEGE